MSDSFDVVDGLVRALTGEGWPSTDAAGALNSRVPLLALAGGLRELSNEVQAGIVRMRAELPREVGDAYVRALGDLVGDRGESRLRELADEVEDVARRRVNISMQVRESKIEILMEVGLLLAQVKLYLALSFFTGGASLGALAAVRARAVLRILLALQALSHSVVPLVGVPLEALEEALQSLAARLLNMATAPGVARPSGVDWSKVGQDALFGAFAGLFGEVLGGASQGLVDKVERKFKDRPEFTVPLNAVHSGVVEGGAESLGEMFTIGALQGHWAFSVQTAGGAAVAGAVSTVVLVGAVGVGKGFHKAVFASGGGGYTPAFMGDGGSTGTDVGLGLGLNAALGGGVNGLAFLEGLGLGAGLGPATPVPGMPLVSPPLSTTSLTPPSTISPVPPAPALPETSPGAVPYAVPGQVPVVSVVGAEEVSSVPVTAAGSGAVATESAVAPGPVRDTGGPSGVGSQPSADQMAWSGERGVGAGGAGSGDVTDPIDRARAAGPERAGADPLRADPSYGDDSMSEASPVWDIDDDARSVTSTDSGYVSDRTESDVFSALTGQGGPVADRGGVAGSAGGWSSGEDLSDIGTRPVLSDVASLDLPVGREGSSTADWRAPAPTSAASPDPLPGATDTSGTPVDGSSAGASLTDTGARAVPLPSSGPQETPSAGTVPASGSPVQSPSVGRVPAAVSPSADVPPTPTPLSAPSTESPAAVASPRGPSPAQAPLPSVEGFVSLTGGEPLEDLLSSPLGSRDGGESGGGRAWFSEKDMDVRREGYGHLAAVRHRVIWDPVVRAEGPVETLEGPGAGYTVALHVGPRGVELPLKDGRTGLTDGQGLARVIMRRKSFSTLPPGTEIRLLACNAAAQPQGEDLLEQVPIAQDVASRVGKVVRADTGAVAVAGPELDRPARFAVIDSLTNPRHRDTVFHPEPAPGELEAAAWRAGLVPGTDRPGERALRWLRAIRREAGPDLGHDPQRRQEFETLLRGAMAWENARLTGPDTPAGDMGPLTSRELSRLLDRHRASHPGDTLVEALARTTTPHPATVSTQLGGGTVSDRAENATTARTPSTAAYATFIDPSLFNSGRGYDSDRSLVSDTESLTSETESLISDTEVAERMVQQLIDEDMLDEDYRQAMVDAVGVIRNLLPDGVFDREGMDDAIRRILLRESEYDLDDEDYEAVADTVAFHGRPAASFVELTGSFLVSKGALSETTQVEDASGQVVGRNWRNDPIGQVDLGVVSRLRTDVDGHKHSVRGSRRTAPWQGRTVYLLVADAEGDRVQVMLDEGQSRWLDPVALAEVIRRDDKFPQGAEILLAPALVDAGGGSTLLPRALADASTLSVWAPTANSTLTDESPGAHLALANHDPGAAPWGQWLFTQPGRGVLPEHDPTAGQWLKDADGKEKWVPDADLRTYPTVAGGDRGTAAHHSTGRVSLHPQEWAQVEHQYPLAALYTTYYVQDPVTRNFGARRRTPWADLVAQDIPVYEFSAHGDRDGRIHWSSESGGKWSGDAQQTAGWLRRRRSLTELDQRAPAGHRAQVLLEVCHQGSLRLGTTDPLLTPEPAQDLANALSRRVMASPSAVGTVVMGRRIVPFVDAGLDGTLSRWRTFDPEPDGDQLVVLARMMKLQSSTGTSVGAVPTALRLVRALRRVFGPRAELDAKLLVGIGALERLRSAHPELNAHGPFTMDFFDHAAELFAQYYGMAGEDPVAMRERLLNTARIWEAQSPPGTPALASRLPMPAVTIVSQEWAVAGESALGRLVLGDARTRKPPASADTDRTRAFWSMVRGRAAVDDAVRAYGPDPVARLALHLDESTMVDESVQRDLWIRASQAWAHGYSDAGPAAWAAQDLEHRGVLAVAQPIVREDGSRVGVSLAGTKVRELDTTGIAVGAPGALRQTGYQPWRRKYSVVEVADIRAETVVVHGREGSVETSHDSLAHLILSRLRGAKATEIVLVGPVADRSSVERLAQATADVTGRAVHIHHAGSALLSGPDGRHVIAVTDPASPQPADEPWTTLLPDRPHLQGLHLTRQMFEPRSVGPDRDSRSGHDHGFDLRRLVTGIHGIDDLTVQVEFGPGSPATKELEVMWQRVKSGVDDLFNRPAHRFPGSRQLHVTVERVEAGKGAHLRVDVAERLDGGPTTRRRWRTDATSDELAVQIGRQLGLGDPDSDTWTPGPDGLTPADLDRLWSLVDGTSSTEAVHEAAIDSRGVPHLIGSSVAASSGDHRSALEGTGSDEEVFADPSRFDSGPVASGATASGPVPSEGPTVSETAQPYPGADTGTGRRGDGDGPEPAASRVADRTVAGGTESLPLPTVSGPGPAPVSGLAGIPEPSPPSAAAPELSAAREAPWYLDKGALGIAFVERSDPPSDDQATRWAQEITDALRDTRRASETLLSGLRPALKELLLTAGPREWDELLAKGRTLVVDRRLIWLRPRPVQPRPRPTAERAEVREYAVGFAATSTGGETSREVSHGLEATLLGAIGVSSGSVAAILPGLPSVSAGTSRKKVSKWGRSVISSRKPFIAATAGFDTDLQVKIFVDGEELSHGVVTPRTLVLGLPADYTAPGAQRPDETVPPPDAAVVDPSGPAPVPPRAHLVLNALDTTEAVSGLMRALRVHLRAKAVQQIMAQVQTTLNETSILNRGRWLLTSGDVTNAALAGQRTERSFEGHFWIKAEIEAVQYLGMTAAVGVRDDLGGGWSEQRKKEGHGRGGLGFFFSVLGPGDGGGHSTSSDGASGRPGGGTAPQGIFPAFGLRGMSERSDGHSLTVQTSSHTVLTARTAQARYGTRLRLVVKTVSPTHTVAPVDVTVWAELGMPQSQAAGFEGNLVGALTSLGGARPRQDRDQSSVSPWPPAGPVDARPWVRALLRASGTDPVRVTTRPARLDAPLPLPHPREPRALAARRGQGFGMLVGLPGSELVLEQLRWAIDKDLGPRADSASWSTTDRDLAQYFGTPALEGDLAGLLRGFTREVSVGGRRYRVGVRGRLLERHEPPGGEAEDRTINARLISERTVAGHRKHKWSLEIGGGAAARLGFRNWLRLQLGALRVTGNGGRADKYELSGTAKAYRRTETAGPVDTHIYDVVYELSVSRPGGDGPGTPDVWWIDRPGELVALVDVPRAHVPAVPLAQTELAPANWSSTPPWQQPGQRWVDFAGGGTSGIYPAFTEIPELPLLAAYLHSRLAGVPESQAQEWASDWRNWPDAVRDGTTATELAAEIADLTGAQGGLVIDLPERDGFQQLIRLRLTAADPQDLGPVADEAEIEHYLQAGGFHQTDTDTHWGVGVSGLVGLHMRFDTRPTAHEPGEGSGTADPQGDGHEGLTGRLAAFVPFGYRRGWSDERKRKLGNVMITRATYGGRPHTVRATPVFEVTAMRRRGRKREEMTRYLPVPGALELLVPERRMVDLLPPVTGGPGDTVPPSGTHAPAVPDAVPGAPSAPPVQDPRQTESRTILDAALLPGVAHPELLRGDKVLDRIHAMIRSGAVLRGAPAGDWPDLLMRALHGSYASHRLEAQYPLLITSGVRRWLPLPGPFGTTRYLWINVTGSHSSQEGQRPRPDVTLTLRSEGVLKEETGTSSDTEGSIGVDIRGHAGYGHRHGGGELGAGYRRKAGRSVADEHDVKDIQRTSSKGPAHEVVLPLKFRVEMGLSSEPPAGIEAPVRWTKRALLTAGDMLGTDSVERLWYRARPWIWHADSETGGSIDGEVRLLVPAELTVPVQQTAREPGNEAAPVPLNRAATGLDRRDLDRARWTPGAATTPAAAPGNFSRQALADVLHPWAVPAATAAASTWIPLAARRSSGNLDSGEALGWPLTLPPRLDPGTQSELLYRHYTSEGMLRANIGDLLAGRYVVPFGDATFVLGLEPTAIHPLIPGQGGTGRYKARRYRQDEHGVKVGDDKSSGWYLALGPEGGDSHGDVRLTERAPFELVGVEEGEKHESKLGETHESNKESVRVFRHYRVDARLVIAGAGGALSVDVPHALYAKLPLARDGETLADDIVNVAPELFVADGDAGRAVGEGTVGGATGTSEAPGRRAGEPEAADVIGEPHGTDAVAAEPYGADGEGGDPVEALLRAVVRRAPELLTPEVGRDLGMDVAAPVLPGVEPLRVWAGGVITDADVPAGTEELADGNGVTIAELRAVGVPFDPSVEVEAILAGGVVPAGSVSLTTAQRYWLHLCRQGSPADEVLAGLLARTLGLRFVFAGGGGPVPRAPEASPGPTVLLTRVGARWRASVGREAATLESGPLPARAGLPGSFSAPSGRGFSDGATSTAPAGTPVTPPVPAPGANPSPGSTTTPAPDEVTAREP